MTRVHLLLTSALVLAAAPGRAQTPPAPGELPTGMRVIAGQATANTQGSTLQVTQGSNRAALDWSSFNIGSQATVRFHDPSAQAMTLNRVSGPNASMIAGHLTSNGQMVLINQSGVVFMPGAVVDAQSVVISAAGITEAGMRSGVASGHFVLDQPAHPGAAIVNRGRISVARAGLAALVAPQVANHGTIAASFGTVSLQGVASHVVDLYGDGLLSIDVSRQTVQGAGGEAALVTNDGLIAARNGTVLLSTDAVEGVVDNLITAGGTIDASGDGRGGRVLIDAQGGSAEVTGTLVAQGDRGGAIGLQASELVVLQPGAVVDASGRRAGGTVAIGTTLARARNGVSFAAPAAKLVGIAEGAHVSADALDSGQGGRITVLSTDNTVDEGLLTARGGAAGGNGGTVEVSGTLGLSLLGTVDVTAVHGSAGHLVIDPTDLVVQSGGTATLSLGGTLDVEPPPPDNTATIDPNVLQQATGDVTLISHDNIDVLSGFSLNSFGLLTLAATSGTITVGGAITNNGGGIVMTAGSDIFINAAVEASGSVNIFAGGALTQAVGAPITSTGSFVALSAAGAITLNDAVSALTSSVDLVQASSVTQNGGAISAGSLFSQNGISGAVSLPDGNAISTIGTFTATGGFTLTDSAATVTIGQPITVTNGPISINADAGTLSVQAALSTVATGAIGLSANTDITVSAAVTAADGLSLTAAESATTGAIDLQAAGSLTSTNNAIALSAGSSITLAGNVTATNATLGSVNLEHGATFALTDGVSQTGGAITATSLFSASGIGGTVSLPDANAIGTIGTFTATGGFALTDIAPTVTVTQPITVTDGVISIDASSGALSVQAALSTVGFGVIALSADTDITVGASVNAVNALSLTAAENTTTGSIDLQAAGSLTSINEAILLFAGSGITLAGNVTATNAAIGRGGVLGTLEIEPSGSFDLPDGVSQTGGAIDTNLIQSNDGIGGDVSLTQATNNFGTLGALSSGGNITLVDSANLFVAGFVQSATGGTISITAPQLSIDGDTGFLSTLGDGGGQVGTIEVSPQSGVVTLGAAGSGFSLQQDDLDQFATGLLRIGKTVAGALATSVTVGGSFDIATAEAAATLELDAGSGGIALTGGPLIAPTLLLGTPGLVSQTVDGAINADTLAGVGTLGTVELGAVSAGFPVNSIGTLGPIATSPGEIDVASGEPLSLIGSISSPAGLTLEAAGAISLAGSLATGPLSLTTLPAAGSSDVVWTTPITATSVTGSIDGNLALTDTNSGTTTLTGLSVQGTLTVTASGGALTTSGAVSGTGVTLAANGLLDIAGTVTSPDFDLSAASIDEDISLGHLDGLTLNGGPFVGLLTSSGGVGGAATMLGTNALTVIQSFVAGGTLALADSRALVIGSGVGASSATFDVTGGNALQIDDPLTIPAAGTLSLRADSISLNGSATSEITSIPIDLIAVAPDSIETVAFGVGAVSGAGTLALSNGNFLLSALQANTLELGGLPGGTLSASRIVIAGASLVTGETLLLDTTAAGSLTQTAALTVDTLGGNIGSGGVVLTNTANSIGTIAGLTVAGNASLVDAAPLAIGGAFSAAAGGTLAVAADTFTIDNGGSLSAGTVAVGPLSAGRTLGISGAPGSYNIELGDLTQITATTLQAGASGIAGTATALQVTLAGNATLTSGDTLVLNAGSLGVQQIGGVLTVGTLGGTVTGGGTFGVALAGNSIGQLGGISAAFIDIADSEAVQVTGLVQDGVGGALTLTAPGITVESADVLGAANDTLALNTDALSHVGSNVVFDPGTIDISPFTAGAVLTVGPGHVDLTSVSSAVVTLTGTSGVVFSSDVTSGAPVLNTQAAGASVTETAADVLAVATLEGTAGSLSLPGTNTVGTLAGFTVDSGNFFMVDSGLVVTAPVVGSSTAVAQGITLSGASLTLDPGATFSTTLSASAAGLVLQTDTLAGSVSADIPGGTVLLERLTPGPQTFAQSGGITAGTLQIGGTDDTSTSITLGALSGISVTTLQLQTSGAVTQTDSLVAPGSTLTGQAGSVALINAGNSLVALGDFTATAGGFALTDTTPLTVIGNVFATNAFVSDAAVSLTDTAAVQTALSLDSGASVRASTLTLTVANAGVAQDATSVVTAATLAGSVGVDLSLAGTNNAIGAVTSLSVGGVLMLVDTSPLTEAASGTLIAGTLTGTFGSSVTLSGTANDIATLGPITAFSTLSLTDGDPTLAGTVQASQISLFVDGIGYASGGFVATGLGRPPTTGTVEIAPRDGGILYLGAAPGGLPFVAAGVLANVDAPVLRLGEADGRVTATGIAVEAPVAVSSALPASEQVAIVDLQATGPVTEAAGATFGVPATLTGNTGAVSLTGGANAIPALSAYTTNGSDFALDDSGALAVEGDVAASGITLAVAGALSLDAGSLLAPGGTVDLTAASASEGAGIIEAAVLDSSGTPGTFLLSGANRVDTLGNWNGSGALTLVDDTTSTGPAVLTVAGPVDVTALTLQAASIALTGNVSAGSSASLATTAGGVTQSGGTLSAGLLTSPGVAGDVLLGSAGNAITSLGAFSVPGHSFVLTDSVPLGVVDALTATAVTLTDPASLTVTATITAPGITVRGGALAIDQGGALVASGGTVDLVASGATESGGAILASTLLSGGTPSGAFVLGGANSIDVLGTFQMASGGSLLLVDNTALAIAGAVSADSVDLSTNGNVTETTGSLSTGLLSSSFGVQGGMTLENAGNAIAALGDITAGFSVGDGANFILGQPGPLEVRGTVSAVADIVLRLGGALTIDGSAGLNADGAVDLTADGAVEAASGAINAALLESSQGGSGNWFLTGTNQVSFLGPFSDAGGALTLSDTTGLQVDGPIIVGALGLQAPSVTLAGDIGAASMQVTTSTGGVTQTAGVLSVGLLSAPAGVAGAMSLPDANQITALGDFAAQGTVTLNDSTDLAINGAVSAPAGVALTVSGNLTEGPGGTVATPLLSGNAAAVTLAQAGNAIGTLDFATTGSLALVDAQSLAVGALSDLGASLSVTGDLTLAGDVTENQSLLTLNATGAVTQTAGVVKALQLDGTANSFGLTASNSIAELANIVAPGGFTLVNASGLLLFGPVQGGVIDLSIASRGILQLPDGILSGQLRSTGGIVGDTLLTAANRLSAVGPLTDQGSFVLSNTQALAVGNVNASTLDLSTSAGGISQNGPITASILQSSAGIVGAADFADTGNQIGTLGTMTVTGGDLTLADATSLTLAGRLTAPDASLTVAGSVTQAGDVVVSGNFATDTLGTYTRSAGALQVGTLSGRATGLADFGTAAAVQRIGAFTVSDAGANASQLGNFALSDATGLTLAGPLASDYVRISATGTLVWSGNLITLGLPRQSQSGPTPSNPGSYLQVVAGAGGTAQILQTGMVDVISQDAFLSTLRLQTPATGGNIVLNDLEAPQTDLLVFIGAGRASGRIDVGNLLVSGQLGGADFNGIVRGLLGQAAARASSLAPMLNANYRVNSCPIASVNCILLPVETVPQQNPLRDLAIGQARDDSDDTDVLLPNVAEQDY